MKVSIITPSYNQSQFIERTIQSVLSQDYANIEYIIMDGGSTDGTIEILNKYSDKIIWKSEKDNGQSDAINKGLKMATGDIVAYLNSDDTYEPEAISKAVKFFQENPEKKWAYGKCKIINKKDQKIRKPITAYKNLLLKKYSYSKLLTENFISQPATFWKKELHQELGYFDENENFCMDYEFWLRLGQKYPAGVINEYLANFRYYSNSKSGSVNKQQFRDQLRLAKKYGANHPLSIAIHNFNYYKITGVYQFLEIITKLSFKLEIISKSIFRKAKFLLKVFLGKEIYIPVQKKIKKEYIGSEKYGGWFISPFGLNTNSLVYSFGIGQDISFDLDLIKKFGCEVVAFDPTPNSIKWLRNQNLPEKFSYYEYGIGEEDKLIKLFPPKNPTHISHSIFPKNSQNLPIKVDVKKLSTIMKELGHKHITILKMDIEGSEYAVIDQILENNVEIEQILIEFHHRFPQISPKKTRDTVEKLNKYGYKIFAISSSREEYSFIKSK